MNEHKRVKHGELPGEVHRAHKIAMREADRYSAPVVTSWGQELDPKGFKRYLLEKSRTVQRRRDKRVAALSD